MGPAGWVFFPRRGDPNGPGVARRSRLEWSQVLPNGSSAVRRLSAALALALALSSPGPLATRACAAVVRASAAKASGSGVAPVPRLQVGVQPALGAGGATLKLTPTLAPTRLSASPSAVALVPAAAAAAAASPAVPLGAATAAGSAAQPRATAGPTAFHHKERARAEPRPSVSPAQALRAGQRRLKKAEGLSGALGALDELYSGGEADYGRSSVLADQVLDELTVYAEPGSFRQFTAEARLRRRGGLMPAAAEPEAEPSGRPAEPKRQTAGREAAAQPETKLAQLEQAALDQSKPLDERLAAVESLAAERSEAVRAALARVAEAHPEGGAQDYEVHRAARRNLAEKFDELRSLRPMSEAHEAELLAGLEVEVAVFDYDDTLEAHIAPISAETGAGLAAAQANGVDTVILTDRPDRRRHEKDTSIHDSLAGLDAAAKAGLTVISDKGTKTSLYDRQGQPVVVQEEIVAWTAAERAAILAAAEPLREKYGEQEYPAGSGERQHLNDFSFVRFLPLGTAPERVEEAAEFFEAALITRGMKGYDVVGRTPAKADNPAYLLVSKTDKSIGVARTRATRRYLDQMRDALRFGFSGRVLALARRAFSLFPKRPVPGRKLLLVGDQMMGQGAGKGTDEFMLKGAPEAVALGVGGTADPRHKNAFLLRGKGKAATLRVLAALGKKRDGGLDRKAVFGLFAQRTLSISVFILTTIAFTAVAVPAVGWGGYGALMALGSLVPIAAGPINGWLVDKLSIRNSMALNTLMKTGLELIPVALVLTGSISFGSLLLASLANYWVLSSTMTTESAYVKRLAGQKHVGTVNSLLWLNYLAVQVLLALIFGVGQLVGIVGPVNAFLFAAGVHALLILPIIWLTMPNARSAPRTLPELEAELAALRASGQADAAREAALARGIAGREKELAELIAEHGRENERAVEEIGRLEAAAPQGALDWLRRGAARAQIRALEAESAGRAREAAAARAELDRAAVPARGRALPSGETVLRLLKTYWPSAVALAAAFGIYHFVWASAVPIAAALLLGIAQTAGYRMLKAGRGRDIGAQEGELAARLARRESELEQAGPERRPALEAEIRALRAQLARWRAAPWWAMLYLSLSALFLYPLQYFMVPRFTERVTGKPMSSPESTLLFGRYLGSLFFGNMISTAANARLPAVRVPLSGRVPLERFVQAAVAALAGIWFYTMLVPGSLLAAAGGALAAAALMALAAKLSARAWVRFIGAGFAGIWLPHLFWGAAFLPAETLMYASLLLAGMAYGPAMVALSSMFQRAFSAKVLGKMIGVQGSFFNAAISIGIGLSVAVYGALNPAFPALLAVFGGAYALLGALFFFAPRSLPALPETHLRSKGE